MNNAPAMLANSSMARKPPPNHQVAVGRMLAARNMAKGVLIVVVTVFFNWNRWF